MARGQIGSLFLTCVISSITAPRRFIPTLSLQSCSPTIRGLYREASPWPVSRLGRSQATKFNQQPPWVGPSPLVICAVEAHPTIPLQDRLSERVLHGCK